MRGLQGRVGVVTGGSSGVGKGIALELVAARATVYVTARSAATTEALAGKPRLVKKLEQLEMT